MLIIDESGFHDNDLIRPFRPGGLRMNEHTDSTFLRGDCSSEALRWLELFLLVQQKMLTTF
jgi:hypothetical protein